MHDSVLRSALVNILGKYGVEKEVARKMNMPKRTMSKPGMCSILCIFIPSLVH